MKRILCVLAACLLVFGIISCSPAEKTDTVQVTSVPIPMPEQTKDAETTPEPEPYTPMDLFGIEFNPYADTEFPDNFTVLYASFNKGSRKLEGKNPFILSLSADGNMYAAVAYLADVSGLSEQGKIDRFDDYSKIGFCEFTGTDGTIVTIKQQQPHDEKYENGACHIDLTYNVPDADLEKYTDLIRDNYNLNALASINDFFNTEPDFAECSIEVILQNNETNVAVQYYIDDADAIRQRVAETIDGGLRDWNGIPSAVIPYGLINNTLVFDSKFGSAILVMQSSNDLNSTLGEYVEPEFSFAKFGFGFDDVGTCGVYEQHEPHYMNVAIHRPEWGEFNEDWNIEYLDQINGYGLQITYNQDMDSYHISLDKGNERASFEYLAATKEYTGQYPDPDTVNRMFNDAFGTQGEDFYDKPLAYFKQLVQERFGMSIDELYALPKQ